LKKVIREVMSAKEREREQSFLKQREVKMKRTYRAEEKDKFFLYGN